MSVCFGMFVCGAQGWAAESDKKKEESARQEQTGPGKQTEKGPGLKSSRLPDVSVTASRIEKQQLETAAFVDVMTQADMDKLGGFSAYEMLKRNGGLNFTSHMPFGLHMGDMSSSIGFRGLKNGELVLLNGLSIMDPSYGYYDIDMIPAAFLERIEVVDGAASTLYGSQAMTGVINMQLVSPGPQRISGEALGGSHGSFKGSGVYRNEYFVGGVAYSRGDELTDLRRYLKSSTPYNTSVLAWDKAAAMFGFQPWKPLTISYMFNYLKSGWDRDYYNDRSKNYEVNEKSYRHYLLATYKKGNFKVSPYFFYNNFKRDYTYADVGKPLQIKEKNNYTTGFDVQNHNQFGNFRLLYGATYIFEKQDEDNEEVSGSSSKGYSIIRTIWDNQRSQGSLFAQGEFKATQNLTLTAGVRLAAVWPDKDKFDDTYEVVPQVQGLYRINKNNSIYANVGRGFKAPTFGQLYLDRDRWAPNPDLEPEHGWTYELGWKTEYDRLSATIAAFYMDFKDKLSSKWQENLQAYQYVNMDEFSSAGVQVKTRLRLTEHLALHLNGYAADPKEESGSVETQAGPKYQISPGLFYDNGVFNAGVYAEFVVDRERGLPDYTNVHLNAGYMIFKWMKIKLQVDNLLDDRDQVIYGNLTPGNPSLYATYDPGLWIMGGVEIYFDLF
ncbi:MAG: TonB-dependent receptor [Desulfarculaceae bacterium]